MRTPYELGLAGRVVLVTGGVRGVGAGISRVFDELGATVITCARRPGDTPYEFHSCDVRDEESVDALINTVVSTHGRLDAVVNNAGGAPFALAADASHNFHRKIIELNLLSALLVSQRANAVMQRQDEGGTIVNITSVSASRPSPGTAAYGAAKAGLESLTRSLAVEWAPKVRVNALAAGMIRTELSEMHYGDEEGIASVGATVPLGRLANPDEIGWTAAFLASPLSSYVTGSVLTVHGGGERPAFLDAANVNSNENGEKE
ncbi:MULTISPECIES: SDR family oxidoreductase [Mycobacteroides]|uniref:SDR family oxidoreductase n=1 Tax=Mycobacteroides chelonae TaxID=1774 RepID=A0AB73MG96_MYCCH|nr:MULTISPECIES: SDR family oxidoreductase [Mycobacteroides]KRQ27970.1 short-chain dehydrogenase [Mycobacteroides sp. H072]KRQ41606.1 short-chain dehydrogenase [Mycobacteroides sp. H002]KRQ49921.1 short-chain dehydrogenase [Mycobacteroides sp. H054]KRQ67491.1 short-chain dehydrogenase [Mycobacteroides sp. H001]MBF9329126.1 SDR family oxidoreductase [Mycobacteroides chelonae]